MVFGYLGMAATEIETLKCSLCTQHQVLQKLENELDVEREASSTAANEALSMIYRLQEERAAEKMEAKQYRRMTEEKMFLAEETLAIFEEILERKEMEISYLEFQVQAYKQKLSSLGIFNLGIEFPNHRILRRNVSLPVRLFKGLLSKKSSPERGLSISMLQRNENSMGSMIEQIDEWMKDKSIHVGNHSELDLESEETREPKANNAARSSKSTCPCSSNQVNYLEKLLEPDVDGDRCTETAATHSKSFHDIFEVAQNYNAQQICEVNKQAEQKLITEADNTLWRHYSMPSENIKYSTKDELQWIKKTVLYKPDQNKPYAPQNGVTIECYSPKNVTSPRQDEIQQLHKRLQLLEDDFQAANKESSHRKEVEIKLLMEICEQLKTIQPHMRSAKLKKRSPLDDSLMESIVEAMLHFSL